MKFKQIYDKHKTLIIAVIVGVLVFFATSFVFPFFLQNNYETFSADQEISYTREEYISGDAYDSDYEYEPSIASMALFTKESSSYSEEEERKIEKTAYISLEAEKEKYVATKAALDNVAATYGGYYTEKNENKRTYRDNEYSTYTITLKIPQEYFDLAIEDIKGIAERFARLGFNAIAPDLYHGKVTMDRDEARGMAQSLDRNRTMQDIDGAAKWLTEQLFASGSDFGTVGYCMGGGLSLRTASHNANVKACAVYYGGAPDLEDIAGNIRSPVLAFYGSDEEERANQLRDILKKHNKQLELHVYQGAKHGFFNSANMEVHHVAASYDTWPRVIDFFRKNLR